MVGGGGIRAAVCLADAGDVAAWMRTAKAGEVFVYARGWLRALGETGERVRHLADSGLVRMHLRRSEGIAEHVIVRTAQRGVVPAQPPARKPQAPIGSAEQDRLLRVLTSAAKMRLPCPSNARLAELAELRDRDQAAYHLSKLARAGSVRVETIAPGTRAEVRVITIAETGRSTQRPDAD